MIFRKICILMAAGVIGVCLGADANAKSSESVAAELKKLESKDPGVRLEAIKELSKEGSNQSKEALAGHMKKEKDPYVKIQAIEASQMNRSSSTFSAILVLLQDENPQVRLSAMINLGYEKLDDNTIINISRVLKLEKDIDVKRAGINTLGLSKKKSAVDAVSAMLNDNNVKVRKAAVSALENIGTKEALQALEGKRNEPDMQIRQLIDKTIKKLKK